MFLPIIIPTYNEAENISKLLEQICQRVTGIECEILIVDDDSPDKTAEYVERFKDDYNAKTQNNSISIRIVKRKKKEGIIRALDDGLKNSKGENILMMDADFSHNPDYIPTLINELRNDNDCDVVIGSRYMKGGKVIGWPLTRLILSKGATFLAQFLLKLEFSEIMNGFYIFRKKISDDVEFSTNGQKFLLELLVKGNYKKVKEIPIIFKNRTAGKSKFNFSDVKNFLSSIIELRKFKKIK